MAGGGGRQGGSGDTQLQNWLQQFPQASPGAAAANPQATQTPPWQLALQRLGQSQQPGGTSPLQMMTAGMGMANQGMARPQMPMMQRPQPQLSPAPGPQNAAGMNPQLLQLMQQRGLMG